MIRSVLTDEKKESLLEILRRDYSDILSGDVPVYVYWDGEDWEGIMFLSDRPVGIKEATEHMRETEGLFNKARRELMQEQLELIVSNIPLGYVAKLSEVIADIAATVSTSEEVVERYIQEVRLNLPCGAHILTPVGTKASWIGTLPVINYEEVVGNTCRDQQRT